MATLAQQVEEAIDLLGGKAHLSKIVDMVRTHYNGTPPRTLSENVRARIEEHSSDSKRFQHRRDVFYSVYGLGRGWWGLRKYVPTMINPDAIDDYAELEIEQQEGMLHIRIHLERERSRTLIKAFKVQLDHFRCTICNFDFGVIYGDLGKGFIEAHHTLPISEIKPGVTTKLSDLVAVCSNCHRMLHRNGLVDWKRLKHTLIDRS